MNESDPVSQACRLFVLKGIELAQREACDEGDITAWQFLLGDGLIECAMMLGFEPQEFCYKVKMQLHRMLNEKSVW